MSNWHNCYLKVQATPFYIYYRVGGEGGLTSTCVDSTYPMFVQMGQGYGGWPTGCTVNAYGYYGNRNYLGVYNPPTVPCTAGFDPVPCCNGYYFTHMSWGSWANRPWRDAGTIYLSFYRRTRFQVTGECQPWLDAVYQPIRCKDFPGTSGTRIKYERKAAGCACIDPPQ